MDPNNKYTAMQRAQYEREADMMNEEDHQNHNYNPEYWGILLGDVVERQRPDAMALDFGCGTGRNVRNLSPLVKTVYGCDIAQGNITHARRRCKAEGLTNVEFWQTDGVSLNPPSHPADGDPFVSNAFDFVMSTIVFQHIPVHSIRCELWKHIFHAMRLDGIFSFQMGFGPPTGTKPMTPYLEDNYDAVATNGRMDCWVENEEQIADDLIDIGFDVVTTELGKTWDDPGHSRWIYVRATK